MLLAICTISLLATSIKSLAQPYTNTPASGSIKQGSNASNKQTPTSLSTPSQNILTLNDTSAVKKETDWFATLVSLFSLGVSGVVAYKSLLKKQNIKLCFGKDIILFPIFKIDAITSCTTLTGVQFNLPITFYNWSPQGGTIERIRLVVVKDGHDNFYDMIWTAFVKIGISGNFENDSLAQPIPVKGLSSVSKVIQFDWMIELGGRQFEVKSGKYKLRIYEWTNDSKCYSTEYESFFTIEDEDFVKFNDHVTRNSTESIWIPLNENHKPNRWLSEAEINDIYPPKKKPKKK
ncbi:MAG: hypothetical protein JGK17_09800 [Microcoleus sp. PH2017_10_PVI_O_A]|uniref:hypothetical protein n=1 Tax=unclassified Microcoleus TaxID=2642155 RepID=UPI001D655F82|nr:MULTISPECIES: hypothetical protein [unclassified Microcoleus]MCC3405868.1 hypothetical protein [Microcoleus sp. PH2017_10_PVI_O_A]MCC3460437.1 hypothetical protein [Microcoleus sp. PH2017_11_PCY_U_A]MCC3478752.1 hypothetical protein [Microcoleus sp. PH2017_12_PCY_D_A]MCC3559656.1 hypothetical protein [Microcoleus sp. PH2017_27_LUM_O_A]